MRKISYLATVEPYATTWAKIEDHAKQRGLLHGWQDATKYWWTEHFSPADVASFLREMVASGVLRPVAKDLASCGTSVLAFRSLQSLKETSPVMLPDISIWLNGTPCEAADAHVWTFRAGD